MAFFLPSWSLLLMMILSALICIAQGGVWSREMFGNKVVVEDEKVLLRGKSGSRPPACERRCGSCGHCEPVQIPAMPQAKDIHSSMESTMREEERLKSNYKPMNWKCKCGDLIFNP